MRRDAIMVTGCPRSGTTILGKILSLPAVTGYIEEPLNYQTGLEGANDFFPYLHKNHPNIAQYDDLYSRMLRGQAVYKVCLTQQPTDELIRKIYRKVCINRFHVRYTLDVLNPLVRRFIAKDPTACFSAEYLARQHDVKVVMALRHPCGVIASHQRLGWQGALHIIWPKKDLAKDYFSKEVKSLKLDKLSPIESLAWFWRATHEVLYEQLKRNPDFPLVIHEDFSAQPIELSRQLFAKLSLPMSERTTTKIRDLTTSKNPTDPINNEVHWLKRDSQKNAYRWKKLINPDDEKLINNITGELYEKLLKLDNRLQTT